MSTRFFTILLLLNSLHFVAVAQEEENDEFTTISTPLTLDLEKAEEENKENTKKKKKVKKNFYYGLKTKKGFTTRGRGKSEEMILFNYLKQYRAPNPYVRDIYWYDLEQKRIMKSRRVDQEKGVLLHGPYKVLRNDIVVEEGIFYIGTKHGRWVRKTPDDILIDKEYYFKGWPKESLVRYYDPTTRTKIKEIIPVEYGIREGYYFYFYEDGNVAVTGEYRYGNKVGKWRSYYPNRRRMREIQYRRDPNNDNFRPYITREWNEAGKATYDRATDKVRVN